MNTPSRRMPSPSVAKKLGVGGWVFLAIFAVGFAWCVYSNNAARWVAVSMTAFITAATLLGHRHFKRMKEERKEESICTFARALPARAHDTMVVRAIFEELSRTVRVPIRPTDNLNKDLRIHPDDLDDVAFEIARRAGRSMENTKANPMFDRVVTVSDMVLFFEQQPKRPENPAG